ncbi:MAG: hypothetical protein [Olavius algarvensis Delta 4 endosymbiont]|nr:MAG: hypothetical protein [Olavius algarvensis Delta 4 endosymbiont]
MISAGVNRRFLAAGGKHRQCRETGEWLLILCEHLKAEY